MSKRLAIHLYGMIRTYKRTHKSFFQNVVDPNLKDGWEIDIFMHTWNVFNQVDPSTWHKTHNYFPSMNNKELTQKDIDDILEIYNPKKFQIDKDTRDCGRYESIKRAMKLRIDYEEEQNVKYDWYLTTRTDIFFLNQLKIMDFIDFYYRNPEFKGFGIHNKMNFCLTYAFRSGRIKVIDHRHPNESDILWFGNYCSNRGFDPLIAFYEDKSIVNVFIKYQLDVDCFQIRETTVDISPNITIKQEALDSKSLELESLKSQYDSKIKELQVNLKATQDSLSSLPIKKNKP